MKTYNKNSKPTDWVLFTKRTNDPKLQWLQITLSRRGIQNRRAKYSSWHAPILEIMARDWDEAWFILTPIDDIPDEDPRWLEPFDVNPTGHVSIFWYL